MTPLLDAFSLRLMTLFCICKALEVLMTMQIRIMQDGSYLLMFRNSD